MKQSDFHTLVGAAVFAAVAGIFGWHSFQPEHAQNLNAQEEMVLHAQFQSVDGISEGSPVVIAGVPVGRVVAQRFDPSSLSAHVSLSISEPIEIPYDSVAMILSDGLVGGKYIRISPGGELDMLISGDSFEYVQNAVIFEEMLEKVINAAEQKRREEKAKRKEADALKSQNDNFGLGILD